MPFLRGCVWIVGLVAVVVFLRTSGANAETPSLSNSPSVGRSAGQRPSPAGSGKPVAPAAPVTYTPMKRHSVVPAAAPSVAEPRPTVIYTPMRRSPTVPVLAEPSSAPISPVLPSRPVQDPGHAVRADAMSQSQVTNAPVGVAGSRLAASVGPSSRPGRPVFGLASDVGMPDGLNLGLVLSPWDWMHLGASLGTNSAALGYRGGLTLVPLGWGPSFSFEAGHCGTADTTATLRYFFSVPSWVRPYVQQIGYTYLNAHVGFDWTFHNLTLFVHGGYTYLRGTVHAPNPVPIVDNLATPPATTTITIAQDGSVNAYSLSAKLGIVYLFGGD